MPVSEIVFSCPKCDVFKFGPTIFHKIQSALKFATIIHGPNTPSWIKPISMDDLNIGFLPEAALCRPITVLFIYTATQRRYRCGYEGYLE